MKIIQNNLLFTFLLVITLSFTFYFDSIYLNTKEVKTHCVRRIRIWSFSGPYLSAFGLNTKIYKVNPIAGKCGPEKLQIRTLFTQLYIYKKMKN